MVGDRRGRHGQRLPGHRRAPGRARRASSSSPAAYRSGTGRRALAGVAVHAQDGLRPGRGHRAHGGRDALVGSGHARGPSAKTARCAGSLWSTSTGPAGGRSRSRAASARFPRSWCSWRAASRGRSAACSRRSAWARGSAGFRPASRGFTGPSGGHGLRGGRRADGVVARGERDRRRDGVCGRGRGRPGALAMCGEKDIVAGRRGGAPVRAPGGGAAPLARSRRTGASRTRPTATRTRGRG